MYAGGLCIHKFPLNGTPMGTLATWMANLDARWQKAAGGARAGGPVGTPETAMRPGDS